MLFIIYSAACLATWHARSWAAGLKSQRTHLAEKMSGFREYAAMQDHIYLLDSIIKKATGDSPDWASIISSINRNIPPGVWLTDFSGNSGVVSKKEDKEKSKTAPAAKSPDAKGEVVIRGNALNEQSLGAWLEELGKAGLPNVRLQYADRTAGEEKALIDFEIKTGIKSQTSPVKADGEGGQ